jgi:predicted dehydrogenase
VTGLGIGMVGCGRAGLDISRAVAEFSGTHVAAAYDREERSAAHLTQRYGGVAHATLESLLGDPAVDIVYVGTPHDQLAPTAHRALTAGRHVLVEKPVALDEAGVRALGRVAQERGLRLGVVFELRESGAVREARRLVQGGAIGAVRTVRMQTVMDKSPGYWHSGRPGGVFDSWRASRASAGGGVALMNSIHQLDTVRYVTGLSFRRVMADVATLAVPVEVEDCAAAALRLDGGAVASLVAVAHSPGAVHEERVQIDGAQGRIDLPDPFGPEPLRLYLREPWQRLPAGRWLDIEVAPRDAYVELLRAFVDSLSTGGAASAGADDAAAAVATVMAIYRSAAAGRAVDASSPVSP